MQTFTKEQIKARFDEVPPITRSAILSADLFETLESISKKHDLHIDQQGTLSTEIDLALLGLTQTKEFEGRIREALSITPEAAKNLASDINNEVFLKIRDIMRKISEEDEREALYEKEAQIRADEEALEEKNEKQQAQAEKRAIVDSLISKPPETQTELAGAQTAAKASILADIENPPETILHTPVKATVEPTVVAVQKAPEKPIETTPIPTQQTPVAVSTPPETQAAQSTTPVIPTTVSTPPPVTPTRMPPVKINLDSEQKTPQTIPKPDPYREPTN